MSRSPTEASSLQLAARVAELERRAPESRIDLGLHRVRRVLETLAPSLDGRRIVSVAGTNGKGSTVAFIDAGLRRAGWSTLAYSSPHLLDFRERFRIDGRLAAAADLVDALDAVEAARDAVPLTYFEQITLTAFLLADRLDVDALVLEVGLGGRLDAVNAVDPDLAVITSIGLDHKDWLGPTRAAIAREKCGIAREGRPVIVAEPRPPRGMHDHLRELGAELLCWGDAFDARWHAGGLTVRLGERRLDGLRPGIAGRHQRSNAAAAVFALDRLGVGEDAIRDGLEAARLAGRFERIGEAPATFVDVAHNPQAARALREALEARPGRKRAVFASLADKDVAGIGRAVGPAIHRWYLAQLDGPRAAPIESLRSRLRHAGVSGLPDALESSSDSVAVALERARADCRGDDEVIVFGSFLTAAAACLATSNG